MEATHKKYLKVEPYPQQSKYGVRYSHHNVESYYLNSITEIVWTSVAIRKSYTPLNTITSIAESVSLPFSNLEKRFTELASNWKKETRVFSTTFHKTLNDNYLGIIGMGELVVPLILKELQKKPDHWFVALHHITQQNPVPTEDMGNIKKMAQYWIEWGKKNNLI